MEKNVEGYYTLSPEEKLEISQALNQAAAPILLRAWNETCRLFLDYL